MYQPPVKYRYPNPNPPKPMEQKPQQGNFAELSNSIRELKAMHQAMIAMHTDLQGKIAQIKQGPPGQPGRPGIGVPGKDGTSVEEEKIIQKILARIPKVKDGRPGRDGRSVKPEELLGTLTKQLEGGKIKLKTSHIEGYQDANEIMRRYLARPLHGGQGSWKIKNLAGTINSINKVFTVSADKPASSSEHVYLNYIPQNPLTDYTLTYAGGTITVTYTTAPDTSLSGLPHIIRFM